MSYLNPLETDEEIQKYSKWIQSKPNYNLYCILNTIKRDKIKSNQRYIKHAKRIKLITNELTTRNVCLTCGGLGYSGLKREFCVDCSGTGKSNK